MAAANEVGSAIRRFLQNRRLAAEAAKAARNSFARRREAAAQAYEEALENAKKPNEVELAKHRYNREKEALEAEAARLESKGAEGFATAFKNGGFRGLITHTVSKAGPIGVIGLILFGVYEGAERIPSFLSPDARTKHQSVDQLKINGQYRGPLGWLAYKYDYITSGWGARPIFASTGKVTDAKGKDAFNSNIDIRKLDADNPAEVTTYLNQVMEERGLKPDAKDSPAQQLAKADQVQQIALARIKALGQMASMATTQSVENEMGIRKQLFAVTGDPNTLVGTRPTADALQRARPDLFAPLTPDQWQRLMPALDPRTPYTERNAALNALNSIVGSPYDAIAIVARKLQTGAAEAQAEILGGEFYSGALAEVLAPQHEAREAMKLNLGSEAKKTNDKIHVQFVGTDTAIDMDHGLPLPQKWQEKLINPPPGYISVQENSFLKDALTNPGEDLAAGTKKITPFIYGGKEPYAGKAAWTENAQGQIVVPVKIESGRQIKYGFISADAYKTLGGPELGPAYKAPEKPQNGAQTSAPTTNAGTPPKVSAAPPAGPQTPSAQAGTGGKVLKSSVETPSNGGANPLLIKANYTGAQGAFAPQASDGYQVTKTNVTVANNNTPTTNTKGDSHIAGVGLGLVAGMPAAMAAERFVEKRFGKGAVQQAEKGLAGVARVAQKGARRNVVSSLVVAAFVGTGMMMTGHSAKASTLEALKTSSLGEAAIEAKHGNNRAAAVKIGGALGGAAAGAGMGAAVGALGWAGGPLGFLTEGGCVIVGSIAGACIGEAGVKAFEDRFLKAHSPNRNELRNDVRVAGGVQPARSNPRVAPTSPQAGLA